MRPLPCISLWLLPLICSFGLSHPLLAQFQTRGSTRVSGGPISIAAGDFNRDGNLDVAEVSYLPVNGVTILLGNGDGTFHTGASYTMGRQLFSVAAVDLRNNGILDLVVGDSLTEYVYVLLSNGDGTFQSPVSYPTTGDPFAISTGDFTGDGNPDIAAITRNSVQCGCVFVFPGNGDGTFQPGISTPVPYGIAPFALVPGDFNADRKLDLAVAGGFGALNQVDILLGNGDGTFQADGYNAVSPTPEAVAAADFNGDTKLDLATVNSTGVSVMLGNGDGTFGPTVDYASSEFPDSLLASDLDGDGKADIAAVSRGTFDPPTSPGVSLFKGNGDGTFQPAVLFPGGGTLGGPIASGDFNGDHLPDLVIGDNLNNLVITLLNTGVVSFSPTTMVEFPFQLINTVSTSQPIILTNNGSSALDISSMTVQGPFRMRSNCGSQVLVGGHCTIHVAFAPKTKGTRIGAVSIADSASSKPQVIALSGTGSVVGLSPLSLAFPNQKINTRSAPMSVQMTNEGSSTLNITKISVTGANYQEFAQNNTCGSQLGVGASCTIRVTFEPRKTGTRSAKVSISDDGGGNPQTITLSGTGIQ